MYFTAYTPIFTYEVTMRMIPNLLPRGHGMYVFIRSETKEETECDLCCYYRRKKCDLPTCPFIQDKIKFGTATKKQILEAVFMNIRNCKFRERLSLFIRESENTNMNYFNKWHEYGFNKALERIDSENYKLISAVYLLTADTQLWRRVQNQVEKNCIHFDRMNLRSVDEKAYTLFCCAKDLYLGTKHIIIADLADEQLISPKMFGIICKAYADNNMDAPMELLKSLHEKFVEVYGTDSLDYDYGFVTVPGVIKGENDTVYVALLELDVSSSGEHWGTVFFLPQGAVDGNEDQASVKDALQQIGKYDYWYTPELERDHHVDWSRCPDEVKEMLDYAVGREQTNEVKLE